MLLLKYLVGLDYKVEGWEHLEQARQQGPVILACKHQSAWETIIFSQFFENFSIVLKKDLLSVPLFGAYLKKLHAIPLTRSMGVKDLKNLKALAQCAVDEKSSILIFPEGHRGEPGQKGTYQVGTYFIYHGLNVPVLPVALDAGVFWKRRGFKKYPGCITLAFCPLIRPGLERKDFMQQLECVIEEKSLELFSKK